MPTKSATRRSSHVGKIGQQRSSLATLVEQGKRWNKGHWQQRGDMYVWVDGGWVATSAAAATGDDHEDGENNKSAHGPSEVVR